MASGIQRHILLQGIVGSTAYGLAGPHSDIDRLGFFTYDTREFFKLKDPNESVVTTEPDLSLHEARKAVRLLLTVNPTVTELLWLPGELYDVRSPLGDELVSIRTSFLSAVRVRNAYLGYTTQQFRRLLARGDGSFSSDTRKRTAKHARHMMRLMYQGLQLYATGELEVTLKDPQRYVDFGEDVATNPETARLFLENAEALFSTTSTPLPEMPNQAEAEEWLARVRAAHYK